MLYAAMQHKKFQRLFKEGNQMRLLTIITSMLLATAATAATAEGYKRDTYDSYGWSAAASTLGLTGLKAGLRGSHVQPVDHKENAYYPGFMAATKCNECH